MSDKQVKQAIERCAIDDSITTDGHELSNLDADCSGRIRKSFLLDTREAEVVKKSLASVAGSSKRCSVRRRTNKRLGRPEPEFGHDTVTYEKIRERILQERAVTNAIDALQERWGMITFMHNDCVELNEKRKTRKLRKHCIQRQFELISVGFVFVLICLLISLIIVSLNKYLL
ncbi:uncharacterized protein LOC123545317 [Mercenaria mercenaria]|uniref:uncharacterized protein LOC123545317 n=1 Tax=Mercenaria mercenaria TaxID=6596 RepID=UPI001E1DF3DC|nr:uncharacterized protein LOC123545317 [Mercenaria mercenaria]